MKLKGKRIVVTGASSGIGQCLLDHLAGYQAKVLGVARREELIREHLRAGRAPRAEMDAFACDLSLPENVDRLFEHLERTWGGADIFMANAGFAYYERIEDPDWARLEAIFHLNTLSVLYSLEKMAHLAGGRDFHFVIMASGTSFLAMPGYALYSATKAALERFVDAYRFEMGPNARISVVYPITTRTAFFEAAGRDVPLPWPIQDPNTVARAIIRGVEKDQQRIYPSRLFRMTLLLDKVYPLVGRVYQDHAARRFRDWLARKKQAGS